MPGLQQKKNVARRHPGLAELADGRHADGPPLFSLKSSLVSPRFGIVKELSPVEADPTEPGRPFVIHAALANHRFLPDDQAGQFSASGKGFTVERASERALGEAVERYSASFWWPEEIRRARRTDLPGRTLDPRALVLYDPAQYHDLPYPPYRDDSMLGWVQAHSLTRGDSIWIPALSAFLTYPATEQELLWPATSNGLAAGPTLADAVLGAALEVIERDAVMIGWLNRVYRERWEASSHPSPEIRELVEAYRRRGVEVGLFRMPTDVEEVYVFLAIARQPHARPAAVVGLGADYDAATAAGKAIAEIAQVRPALRRKLRREETRQRLDELHRDPRLVTSLHDHDLLYAHEASLPKLDFLFSGSVSVSEWPEKGTASTIADLVTALGRCGHELIYCNLTVPDMERFNLFTARAIIPGFQPIDFGWKERRLGGPRIYELPVTLGLLRQPNTLETLNPDPHPIA